MLRHRVSRRRPIVALNGLKLAEGKAHSLSGNYYHVQNLAVALAKREDIRLLVFCDQDSHPPLLECLPTECLRFKAIKRESVISADFAVARLVRRENPDIYHRPTGQLPLFRIPCRTIASIADIHFKVLPTPLLKRCYKELSYRWTILRADAITCVSEFTRQEVIQRLHVAPQRLTTILHGVNPLPPPSMVIAAGIRHPFWITFGHQPRKNVETVVRSLALGKNHGNARTDLVVVGASGHLAREVGPLASQLGVREQVHFVGRIAGAELNGLYRNALGLVFMSYYEGFGLPILEAMSSGCPVICSNVSSLPEVAGDAGVLLPPNDSEALAAVMKRWYEDPAERSTYRERGLARAKRFSWDSAADQTVEVYFRVLGLLQQSGVTP